MVRKIAIAALFAVLAASTSTAKDLPENDADFGSSDLVNLDEDFDEYEEENSCSACSSNGDCVSCGSDKLCCNSNSCGSCNSAESIFTRNNE